MDGQSWITKMSSDNPTERLYVREMECLDLKVRCPFIGKPRNKVGRNLVSVGLAIRVSMEHEIIIIILRFQVIRLNPIWNVLLFYKWSSPDENQLIMDELKKDYEAQGSFWSTKPLGWSN